ncbi:MAG: FecR family protein [Spirochaetia bacterium]
MGSLLYREGEVSLERNGAAMDSFEIGQDVESFDVVKTGSDGLAEIDISSPQLPAMKVKVSSETQFSVEVSTLKGKQQTTIGIVGGSVSLKVAKLGGAQEVNVRTDSAAMGVRGTDFTVTAPPTGDVLVTCDEGEVVCTDDQGKELSAIPGTVVEKRPSELFRTVPVAATGLEAYRTQWRSERLQFLQANALPIITRNVRLYTTLSRELNLEAAELSRSRTIIGRWADEDRSGRAGRGRGQRGQAQLLRERRIIGALLVRMRRTVFQLERVEFRIERLQALHERGVGTGTLDGGVTTAQFFERFQRERNDVDQKLAQTRFVTKMFVRRNDGQLP